MEYVDPYEQVKASRWPGIKRLYVASAAIVGAVLLMTSLAGASNLSIGGPSDCDNNAVINCGAHSVDKLVDDYDQSAYVRAVYSAFGISRADIRSLPDTAVAGTVTKQGNVFAGGRLVATNAMTGGRQDIPGSSRVNVNGAIFFERPPSVSFVSDSLPAFVSMSGGRFQFAIIASCGNAVSAAAVAKPPQKTAVAPAQPVSKPKPPKQQPQQPTPSTPAPTPSQTQSQTQTQNNQQVNQNNQQVTIENKNEVSAPAPTPTPTSTTVASVPEQTAATQQAPAQTEVASAPAAATTSAQTLPNTGPGDLFGIFSVGSMAGYLGYRRYLVRKLR